MPYTDVADRETCSKYGAGPGAASDWRVNSGDIQATGTPQPESTPSPNIATHTPEPMPVPGPYTTPALPTINGPTEPPANATMGDTWISPFDVMVYLPKGEFLIGAPDDDPFALEYEKP